MQSLKRVSQYCKGNFSYIVIAAFLLVTLFNPVFKKYDYGSEWLLVLGFCLVLPLLFVVEKRSLVHGGGGLKLQRAEKFFFAIFTVFMALAFAYSQTKNVGLSEVMAYLSAFALYFLLAHRRVEFLDRLIRLIVLSSLAAALLGMVFYIFREEPRMFGPFFNLMHYGNLWPNAFALFLLMSWPLFLVTRYRMLLPVVIAALLLTYSRGALIAFGGQLLLLLGYWIVYGRAGRAKAKAIAKDIGRVAIVAVLTLGLFFSLNELRALNHPVIDVQERATFQNSESLTSKQERIDFWQAAIDLAEERPLLGWGPFSFRYANYPIQKTFLGASDHPHNLVLKMAAENGLVATGALMAFLITVIGTAAWKVNSLEPAERRKVAMMLVAVLGALAHSMIDYNFNFMVNLLLFFLLLAMMRSLTGNGRSGGFPFGVFFVTVMISMWAFYELALGAANKFSSEKSYLDESFFPRNHFLNRADAALAAKDYETALKAANSEIDLNPLDSQAWYLRGVAYCKTGEEELCKESLEKALVINPMNDFNYYADYIRVSGDRAMVKRAKMLLETYFEYVEMNVHFTAFTPNVEAAAALVDTIIPYLEKAAAGELAAKGEQMLKTAKRLREESNKIL